MADLCRRRCERWSLVRARSCHGKLLEENQMKSTLRWGAAILAFVSCISMAGAADAPPPLPGDEPGSAALPAPAAEPVKPAVAPAPRDSEARGSSRGRHGGHRHEAHAGKGHHAAAEPAAHRHGKPELALVKSAKSARQAKPSKAAKATVVAKKSAPAAAHGKPAGKPKKHR